MDLNESLELIHQYSPPGGLVVDQFAGTLVTALACLRLNRRSLSLEKDQLCIDAAKGRLRQWYKWLQQCALLLPGEYPLRHGVLKCYGELVCD